jgi:hypothetical protein
MTKHPLPGKLQTPNKISTYITVRSRLRIFKVIGIRLIFDPKLLRTGILKSGAQQFSTGGAFYLNTTEQGDKGRTLNVREYDLDARRG